MAGQQRQLALVQSRLRFGGVHRVPYRGLGFARLPTVEGASEVVRGFSLWATRCGKLCTSGLESHNVASLRDGWEERNIFDGLTWGCVEGSELGGYPMTPASPEPDELEAIMKRMNRNDRRLASRRRQAARRKAAAEQPPRPALTWSVLRERQRPPRAKQTPKPDPCMSEDEKRFKSIVEPIQDQIRG